MGMEMDIDREREREREKEREREWVLGMRIHTHMMNIPQSVCV